MRLIDKDELKLHKFLKRNLDAKTGSDIYMAGWNDAIDAIVEKAPIIDAVAVVRCKDCKWYKFEMWSDKYYCAFRSTWQDTDEDDFCSYGERKEE